MRELVEASDPGESFGRAELKPLLSNLAEELSYTSETELVAMRIECPEGAIVEADASKLACSLGSLASLLIRAADPGGSVHLKVHRDETMILIKLTLEGSRREPGEFDLNQKLDQIRLDTACSYAWAIGGQFRKTKKGFAIRLPALT